MSWLDGITGLFGGGDGTQAQATPSAGLLDPRAIRQQAMWQGLGALSAGLLAAGQQRPATQPSPLPQALMAYPQAYQQGIQSGTQSAALDQQARQQRAYEGLVGGMPPERQALFRAIGAQQGAPMIGQSLLRQVRDVPAAEAATRLGPNYNPQYSYQDENGRLTPVTTPSQTTANETARVGVTGLEVPGQGGSRYFPFGLPGGGGASPGAAPPAAPPAPSMAPRAQMQPALPMSPRGADPVDSNPMGPTGEVYARVPGAGQRTAQGSAPGMTPPPQVRVTPGPGGRGVSIGAPPETASPATITDLQQATIQGTERMGRLQEMASRFDPQWLTYSGQFTNWGRGILERLGADVGPEARRQMAAYEGFRSTVSDEFNQTLRAMSGAAVTPNEFMRMQGSAPSLNDSPTQFQSKLQTTLENVALANARRHYMLNQGLSPSFTNNSTVIPLSQMRGIIDARGTELERTFRGQGLGEGAARARVEQQLRQEFGMGTM